MGINQTSPGELRIKTYMAFVIAFLVMAAMLFLPADTLYYWEAWVYLAVLFTPSFLTVNYMLKKEPDLIRRRMQFREKEPEQKLIIKLTYLLFVLAFIIPGFDRRFGWSNVPVTLVFLADLFVLFGYGVVFLAFKENHYAGRVIEVTAGQTVVDTGLYAVVRHPMYLGASLIYISSPIALGSYWAIIPILLIFPILIARILNEESVLLRGLVGYREYMRKTRYRLIPGVW